MTGCVRQLDVKIFLGITVLKIKKSQTVDRDLASELWALISSRRNRTFRGIKFESNNIMQSPPYLKKNSYY